MKARVGVLFLVALLTVAGTVRAETQVVQGPELTQNIGGWFGTGLRFTALQNTVLKSFVFNNQGLSDVITLYDYWGNVVGTYAYGGGDGAHKVMAGWPLVAGQTYELVATDMNNGKWDLFSGYPAANDHIRVELALLCGAGTRSYWINFTALETSDGDDEPETLAVGVDVKPGSDQNPVNLKSRGKLPVAVLSDEGFDATSLVVESIQLAGAGVVVKQDGRFMARRKDVNGDGLVDLVALFRPREMDPGLIVDGWLPLTALTGDGTAVEGGDTVKLVPLKKGHGKGKGRR